MGFRKMIVIMGVRSKLLLSTVVICSGCASAWTTHAAVDSVVRVHVLDDAPETTLAMATLMGLLEEAPSGCLCAHIVSPLTPALVDPSRHPGTDGSSVG